MLALLVCTRGLREEDDAQQEEEQREEKKEAATGAAQRRALHANGPISKLAHT